jgi:hypothetical protein
MIESAGVVQDLSPIGDTGLPATEAQVRPNTRLEDPAERRPVWREVLAAAQSLVRMEETTRFVPLPGGLRPELDVPSPTLLALSDTD